MPVQSFVQLSSIVGNGSVESASGVVIEINVALVIFTQTVCQIVCFIKVGCSILPRGSRATDIDSHLVSFRLVCFSIARIQGIHKGVCATLSTGTLQNVCESFDHNVAHLINTEPLNFTVEIVSANLNFIHHTV